ncbi:MAG TPA: hypothetical protein VLU25_15185 [Acidobacteriota bacterium]|nr:hypothetical protein [Acidobacteriota bacterium]
MIRLLEEAIEEETEDDGILEELAGTWSREEAEAFDRELEAQRTIDPEIWKDE